MRYPIALLLTVVLLTSLLPAQSMPLTAIAPMPAILEESSGLIRTGPNKLWSHNDSGGEAKLYCFDTTGAVVRTLTISNASNVDWEEVTRDDSGNVYIGDFGNNSNNRTNLRIYKVGDPDQVVGDSTVAEIIDFSYPDQAAFPPPDSLLKFDMEAMVAYGDSLYLFSKNRTSPYDGYTRRYRLPQAPGTYVATLVDSFYAGPGPQTSDWICGAALSPDKEHLLLVSYPKAWLFSCFEGADFFGGAVVELSYNFTQKEAVAWRDNHVAYLTDELFGGVLGGDLYRADLGLYTAEPTVDLGNDTTLTGDSLVLDAGSMPGATYMWSTGATGVQATVLGTGIYTVEVTAPNGCIARDTIMVNLLTGSGGQGPQAPELGLQVQPNPFSGSTYLFYTLTTWGQVHYELYDAGGRMVAQSAPGAQAPGHYRVGLGQNRGKGLFTLRFVHDGQSFHRRLLKVSD